MGMFDYITCDLPLPELPEEMVKYWGKVAFQTKDTPSQAMSHYHITSEGTLEETKVEGHWQEPEEGAEFPNFGHFVKTKEWQEDCWFSGIIRFYESWKLPEAINSAEEQARFVSGWAEYLALFDKGQLIGEIQLQKLEHPYKRTDKELAEFKEKNRKMREEIQAKCRQNRRDFPTVEQKLIDSIFDIANNPNIRFPRPQIRKLIEEYREKHDIYYTV